MPRLHVCSLALIAETVAKTGARSLVTLLSPGTEVERPTGIQPERHLYLAVSDIVEPMPGQVMPDAAHLEELLGFVRIWDRAAPMLIHCFAGVSRSTAAAYIAACALTPKRDEFVDSARAARRLAHRLAECPTGGSRRRCARTGRAYERSDSGDRPGQGMLRGRAVRPGAELNGLWLLQPFTAFVIASCSACVGEPKKAGSLSLPPSAP